MPSMDSAVQRPPELIVGTGLNVLTLYISFYMVIGVLRVGMIRSKRFTPVRVVGVASLPRRMALLPSADIRKLRFLGFI
jgi:hypothetical protein